MEMCASFLSVPLWTTGGIRQSCGVIICKKHMLKATTFMTAQSQNLKIQQGSGVACNDDCHSDHHDDF